MSYRYTEKVHEKEKDYNRNVREMIEMIKNEAVSVYDINLDNLKLSRHSTLRIVQHTGCREEDALETVSAILKNAKRVGDQISFDGRINILYVYDRYAIYLSPNLEHVITINRYNEVTYKPILKHMDKLKKQYDGESLRQKLIEIHQHAWNDIETREKQQELLLVKVEKEVCNTVEKLVKLLNDKVSYKTRGYDKYLLQRINEEKFKIKYEGHKLFKLKLRKRHVGKSIVAVL